MGAKLAKSVRVCCASIYTYPHLPTGAIILYIELFVYFFRYFQGTALVGPSLRYLTISSSTHRLTASNRSGAGSFTPVLNRSVQRLWHCWVSLGVSPGQLKLKQSSLVQRGNTLLSGNNPLLLFFSQSWAWEIAKLRQKETNCPNMANIDKIKNKTKLG